MPLTAVIPLYNKASEIDRALTSVLRQQPAPDEVIVVDDGSTDGGDAVAHGIEDRRVRLVRQPNRGEGAARNRGALMARDGLVAFCDADDEWLPGFTEAILRLEQRFPECDVYATGYVMREKGGRDIRPRHFGTPAVEGIIPDYFRSASRSDTPLTSSSIAVRRDSLLAVGGFPENVVVGADLLCWARLAARYQLAFSRDPRAVFNLRGRYPSPPVRSPDVPDVVGKELSLLVRTAARPKSMHKFIGSWHRSRAMMFSYQGAHRAALAELVIAAWHSPQDARVYLLAPVALLPPTPRDGALAAIRGVRAARRSSSM